MYSDPLSTTTPAAVGIDSQDCVKWRETLPSQEESAGRDIPMGQFVTNVLLSRESPFFLFFPVLFFSQNQKSSSSIQKCFPSCSTCRSLPAQSSRTAIASLETRPTLATTAGSFFFCFSCLFPSEVCPDVEGTQIEKPGSVTERNRILQQHALTGGMCLCRSITDTYSCSGDCGTCVCLFRLNSLDFLPLRRGCDQ